MVFPPALPAAAYIDRGWFDKEQALLFGRLWQFHCLASLVSRPNQFVTGKPGGVPVVVQNFGGELRAFENVCLHRQAPIQNRPRGCRPMTCPYHGWNYDAEGRVAAIPFEDDYYRFPPEQREGMRLRSFAVARIGGLVFVNLSQDPIPLERQFSRAFMDSLAAASAQFDDQTIVATFHRAFNWKLVFENLRDGLHPAFLHRDSLYKEVKFRPAIAPEAVAAYLAERAGPPAADPFDEVRRWFSKGGPDETIAPPRAYDWHAQVERYGDADVYYNWLAFPNLHIASGNGGYAFIIEHYMPVAPDRTEVEVTYLTAKRKTPYPESTAVLHAHLTGAERVLAEDFAMLEQVQAGLHAGAPPPNWGAYELRNHRIASWIGRVMDGRVAF